MKPADLSLTSNENEIDDIGRSFVAAARSAIALRGIDGFSLRDLSNAAGKSTFSIVRRFGSKAGLVEAAVAHACQDDLAFHRDFFAGLAALPRPSLQHSIDVVLFYLRQRRSMPEISRVLQEGLLAANSSAPLRHHLRVWHAMRQQHWRDWLFRTNLTNEVSALWVEFLAMEEFYFEALHAHLAYDLLLREDLHALLGGTTALSGDEAVTHWTGATVPAPSAFGDSVTSEKSRVKKQLLDEAANQIAESGPASVTNGRLTTLAKVSTSMIAYHFGSVGRYLQAALLHALTREVSQQAFLRSWAGASSPTASAAQDVTRRPKKLIDWARLIVPSVRGNRSPAASDETAGFYVRYARTIGHTCLHTAAQPALAPILLWLRIQEGAGTYGSRDTAWPAECRMRRVTATNFAIWIKGYSLLDHAIGEDAMQSTDHQSRLCEAARFFFRPARGTSSSRV
jgi:AcrR family transcriptional regulator